MHFIWQQMREEWVDGGREGAKERQTEKMAFGPSVGSDEQMWERDRKRKTKIIAAFTEHLEP